jgi:RimJ/RimL family protein N-acetyltransferase
VADEHQGQGLGRLMLRALVDRAAASGIDRLRLEILAENRGAHALARSFGASLRSDGHTVVAVIRTQPATEATGKPQVELTKV